MSQIPAACIIRSHEDYQDWSNALTEYCNQIGKLRAYTVMQLPLTPPYYVRPVETSTDVRVIYFTMAHAEELMTVGSRHVLFHAIREILQEVADRKGHRLCHHEPDAWNKLFSLFGIQPPADLELPPRAEFTKRCQAYEESLYDVRDQPSDGAGVVAAPAGDVGGGTVAAAVLRE